jgi:hypothetical protein
MPVRFHPPAMSLRILTLGLCAAVLALPAAADAAGSAPIPKGWPSATLQLGMRDDEGGAAALRASTKLGARYHYLSGGVNTGRGWSSWSQGGGSFVSGFVQDSVDHGFLPVFSYYQLRESAPGNGQGEEQGDLDNLRNPATMRAYYADLRLFFQKAGETGRTAVLHVEPDLWGYIQRNASGDAANVPAAVTTAGASELAGLPNDARGFAQAIVRLRDRYAPNVLLGYHVSVWGTGEDIADSDPSDAHVDELAGQAASYYASLHAPFDLLFAEYADRDAAYEQLRDGDPRGWWTDDDFVRHARFIGDVAAATGKRVVVWQVPLGNRLMRAMDNTDGHYQDNRVEWLLHGSASRAHLQAYVDAGVIAFLFGPAIPGATCACDAKGDGVTNPSPITGNTRTSLSADDDGGLFRSLANAYYAQGPLALPSAKVRGNRTTTTAKTARFTIRATSGRSARRGGAVTATVRVRATRSTRAVVAVQFYAPGASSPTGQVAFRGQRFTGTRTKTYRARYAVPKGARRGGWKVKVGVFDPDFKTLWQWSENAAAFTVG